jgi:uncharacterized damage-inducible protein DinB
MTARHDSLAHVFKGWDGYQTSLVHAIQPLKEAQLEWRPVQSRRSVGELVRHISFGRITWFARMPAPGIDEAARKVPEWFTDGDGSRHAVEGSVPANDAATLVEWLNISWQPIRRMLDESTVSDLATTYRHRFRGLDYEVSRQWTIWRILSHDCHHGGQIAMMLAIQGIGAFELGALGGHITEPQRAAPQP